ncbi:hypothetical protein GIB67_041065 [Kingdonia uniflora]|uniref:DNA 3'-5' helicase n=1 Tax=Kingdonia uniflora TaxID=39325 RepID=A0A7J7LK34_9MAGN|nr:hypothetical protein GIB67_041065 [Kingdonia uniflora]
MLLLFHYDGVVALYFYLCDIRHTVGLGFGSCIDILFLSQIFISLQEAGIKAGIYHGQMNSKDREESHRSFIRDELHIMVATIAFGMGVDKPNIRRVIHYGCPKSLESYYQGSGRCGRDGLASICLLYYSRSDFTKAGFYCEESHTEKQRTAIMESLMAAQQYSSLTTCRRKFLLEYFGEEFTPSNCGNCDNCTNRKMERDMSREAFLLISCIDSCGGRWGLNMPVDILRGSRSRKILDVEYDKLPLHGFGKDHSSNWWKALAEQLVSHGYLTENVKDIYRTVSVSLKGVQFLSTASHDHQTRLDLALTKEMDQEKEHRDASGKVEGELQSLANLGCEGFSEAEVKLYHLLLEMRLKLARSTGIAPYCICGDQTIKKITMTRPSTRARLANIDGVNQHLVTRYGDHIIQNIHTASQGLELSLDGEVSIQTITVPKLYPISKSQRSLTPAKLEAWKLWHGDGLSFHKIANFPGRPAPIKEQTVLEYVLEAAKEGFEFNWSRFCDEIGMTHEVFLNIEGAISKIGSRERLKPIKEELPEYISYVQIKAAMTMQDLGLSSKAILDPHYMSTDELQPGKSGCSPGLPQMGDLERLDESKPSTNEAVVSCSLDYKDVSLPSADGFLNIKQPRVEEDETPRKCRKTDRAEENSVALQASENNVLEWLSNHGEGVALVDIVGHFKASTEESIAELLSSLQSEYLIYKMNELYRVL